MAFYKENIVDINLNTGNIFRSFLNHSIGYKDDDADRFGIRAFRDGEPVDLSGASCQAIFMNPNGTNIALTSYGTVSGNVAYVTLPPACYDYEGQFCLAIKLVGGGVTGTVRIVDGMVINTGASGTVSPTSAVPTYQEILSTYDAMVAATSAANLAIAETFDATKAYPAGKYVINEGHLYRLTADHAANVTWANTSKVATNFGDDLSSLKSAIKNSFDSIDGVGMIEFTNGGYISTSGSTVDINTVTQNDSYSYAVVDCSEGDNYIINGTGGNVPRLWCFIDAQGNVISNYVAASNVSEIDLVLTAPQNASKLILNTKTLGACYKGEQIYPGVQSVTKISGPMALVFEKGGIDSSGLDTNYRGKARARSRMHIFDFDVQVSCKAPVGNHVFKVFYYNSDGTFSTATESLNTDYIIPSGSYFRIMLVPEPSTSSEISLSDILAVYSYEFQDFAKTVQGNLDTVVSQLSEYIPQGLSYVTGKVININTGEEVSLSNGMYAWFNIAQVSHLGKIRVSGHMQGSNNYPLITFYDSSDNIVGDPFGVKSTTYTNEVINVPNGSAKVLFNTNPNYTNTFEVLKLPKIESNISELRAKFDDSFNYIAYSHIENSGQSINTREHFEWCAKKSVFKTLKADMQLTSDGKIVLCHDSGFTLNGSGKIIAFDSQNNTPIHDMTYAECIALQHNGTDQHVCGLDAVLKVAKKYGKYVYLTLRNEYYSDVLDAMFPMLRKYGMESQTIMNCYPRNDEKADAIRARSTNICIGYTCGTTPSSYPTFISKVQLLGNAILTPYIFFNEVSSVSETLSSIQQYIYDAINQGIRVYVAIVENNNIADDLMDCGVVGCQISVLPTDIQEV